MTQPYGGPNPPPDGPQYPPDDPYGRPAYPPAVDPYDSPLSGPDTPYSGYPPSGFPQPAPSGYPPALAPGYAQPSQPYPPIGQPFPDLARPASPAGPPPTGPANLPPDRGGPVKKKRGPLITTIVAAVLVLVAAAGTSAWLLLRDTETGAGAAEPATAVNTFLKAVYTDKDAAQAARLVCAEARDDDKINKKIDEIKGYDKKYENPRFDWDDPKVGSQNDERAIVMVQLRMVTADEKTAEQQLKFTVVQKTGWWVCDVG